MTDTPGQTPGTSEWALDNLLDVLSRGGRPGRDEATDLIAEIRRLRAVIEGTLEHGDETWREHLAHLYTGDMNWRPK